MNKKRYPKAYTPQEMDQRALALRIKRNVTRESKAMFDAAVRSFRNDPSEENYDVLLNGATEYRKNIKNFGGSIFEYPDKYES